MINISLFFSIGMVMFIAELGDKTNLIVLSLISKTKMPLIVSIGSILGIGITTGIGVLLGNVINLYLPEALVPILAGILFIILGVIGFIGGEEEDNEDLTNKKSDQLSSLQVLFRSASLMFLAEFGDKSQLTVISGTAIGDPLTIFLGAMFGLGLVILLTALMGDALLKKIPAQRLHFISSILFIIVGLWVIISNFIE